MTIRPAKARAPYVSDPLGGITPAPADAQYVVMALDATLTKERVLTAGTGGISLVDGGAGGNATLNNTLTGANVGSGTGLVFKDKTAAPDVLNLKSIVQGEGILVTNGTNDITLETDPRVVPTLADSFQEYNGFWDTSEAVTSGDWQLDYINNYLEGIAENNDYDWIRRNIQGDVDYRIKLNIGTSTSAGLRFFEGDGTLQARLVKVASTGNILAQFSGESNVAVSFSPSTFWIRIVWREYDGFIGFYYKENDSDPWILLTSFTGKAMGDAKILYLDSADGAYIYAVELYDNMYSHQIRSSSPIVYNIGNQAGPTISNVRHDFGNMISMVLTGNCTLGNPVGVGPVTDGTMLIFRIEQDATGSRTLAFDTKYRFSTDLPSPTISTTGGDIDYLGFIYHESDDKWDYIAEVFGF